MRDVKKRMNTDEKIKPREKSGEVFLLRKGHCVDRE
jgi:hypothetical protein